jgi:CRP-like cAMP-binding protein
MRLSKRRFQGLIADEPAAALAMLRKLARRLRESRDPALH